MTNTYKFWLYKARTNKDAQIPVYMQISLDGNRVQIATGVFVNESCWDKKHLSVKPKDAEAAVKNAKLQSLVQSYQKAFILLLKTGDEFTVESIKNKMLGKEVTVKSLMQLLEIHNADLEELLAIVVIKYWTKIKLLFNVVT